MVLFIPTDPESVRRFGRASSSSSSSFYCNKGMTERKPTNDKNTNRNITKNEKKLTVSVVKMKLRHKLMA